MVSLFLPSVAIECTPLCEPVVVIALPVEVAVTWNVLASIGITKYHVSAEIPVGSAPVVEKST